MPVWKEADHLKTATLVDFIDGTLADSERESAERHLGTCETCRHHESELRLLSSRWTRWGLADHAATIWSARADLFEEAGDRERAIAALKEVLSSHRSGRVPKKVEEAETLLRMGRLEGERRAWQAAEARYQEALEIQRLSLGESHPRHISALNCLVALYLEMEAFDRAEATMDQIERILTNSSTELTPAGADKDIKPTEADLEFKSPLSEELQTSLRQWLQRENRSKMRRSLQTLLTAFSEGVNGAFRILADRGTFAIEEMGNLLSPARHWRFGYSTAVALGDAQDEEPGAKRQIRAAWIEDGQVRRESWINAEYDETQRVVTVDMSLFDPASTVTVYEYTPGSGTWTAAEYVPGNRPVEFCIAAHDDKMVLILASIE